MDIPYDEVLRSADMCSILHRRLNYILWLEDLLTSTAPPQITSSGNGPISSRQMSCRGIDMYVLCGSFRSTTKP